jgi:hypothetical protein
MTPHVTEIEVDEWEPDNGGDIWYTITLILSDGRDVHYKKTPWDIEMEVYLYAAHKRYPTARLPDTQHLPTEDPDKLDPDLKTARGRLWHLEQQEKFSP